MKSRLKRAAVILLAVCVLFSSFGGTLQVYAESGSSVPEGLLYEITDSQATITGYEGSVADLVIPDTIEGYPVTALGDYCFNYNEVVKSIVIPEGVKRIGDSAIYYCQSLESISIPSTVTEIGEYQPISWCFNLVSITVAEGNSVYSGAGNCVVERETGKLIAGCGGTVIPDDGSVTVIGAGAFWGNLKLTSVIIPESVTVVEDEAFIYCENITELVINGASEGIGAYAFSCGAALKEITLSSAVTSIGIGAFSGCDGLETVNYAGTEEQWANVTVGEYNDPLLNAKFVFAKEDERVFGDIDKDGKLTALDSNMLKRILSMDIMADAESEMYKAADLNSDGRVNSIDALFLTYALLGLISG